MFVLLSSKAQWTLEFALSPTPNSFRFPALTFPPRAPYFALFPSPTHAEVLVVKMCWFFMRYFPTKSYLFGRNEKNMEIPTADSATIYVRIGSRYSSSRRKSYCWKSVIRERERWKKCMRVGQGRIYLISTSTVVGSMKIFWRKFLFTQVTAHAWRLPVAQAAAVIHKLISSAEMRGVVASSARYMIIMAHQKCAAVCKPSGFTHSFI